MSNKLQPGTASSPDENMLTAREQDAAMPLSKRQKTILSLLLNKYESSRTYRGENQVRQTFAITPEQVMPDYHSDFADVADVEIFERELRDLERTGLITTEEKSGETARIVAAAGKFSDYYSLLGRRELRDQENQELAYYKGLLGRHPVMDGFCEEQIRRLSDGKKARYPLDEARDILKAMEYILTNEEDILERELSIELYRDSKLFAARYRSRVVRLLERYGDGAVRALSEEQMSPREREEQILEAHGIYANPTYIYMKGSGRLYFCSDPHVLGDSHIHSDSSAPAGDDGLSKSGGAAADTVMTVQPDFAVALSSEALRRLVRVEIDSDTVITVENLTSFSRMKPEVVLPETAVPSEASGDVSTQPAFLIYLSGYHNLDKQKFLQLIRRRDPACAGAAEKDPAGTAPARAVPNCSIPSLSDDRAPDLTDIRWLHFGDLDPDGFDILENLKSRTGLPFQPYRMDASLLQKYENYGRPLNANDRTKAENLIEKGMYVLQLTYMLEHDCKLEQEIISWKEL